MQLDLRYLVFMLFLPTAVMAEANQACEELWFARNAMLNDAGYCFSTPLGRNLFDNTDCTTRQPVVDRDISEQITLIQKLERDPPFSLPQARCRIDTSQPNLEEVPYIGMRLRVAFQPATDGTAGGCIGYTGDSFLLFEAPDSNSAVLGRVEPGNSFSLSHLPWGDWNFAIVWGSDIVGEPVTLGWYRMDIGENCMLFAS
ncbi:DUF4453 domain-containing protein [Cognatiyoonia sp. IB215182]|uniref:DUF4453 domain-containing protein n=1 Tax=Cognatiyoonia sp. IB215182 TaxID=3097353 RepID=UPI002A16DFC0|nr:DUF4453 domain-containing protein [Cognatiyoonia sp. IB215182]MDX8354088.1 DUF4453 domain-containing protein [Cognatiyoonia sp. IB215182]